MKQAKRKRTAQDSLRGRVIILILVFLTLFAMIVSRLFTLQILNGESYENDFTLSIEKKKVLKSTRGEIYDCNGNLLAYNELIYEVTFEDKGSYADSVTRNLNLNGILYTALKIIESHGDSAYNNFKVALDDEGNYVYTVKGFNLSRFKADFFGYQTIDEMKSEEADITAPDLIALMCSDMGSTLKSIRMRIWQNGICPGSFRRKRFSISVSSARRCRQMRTRDTIPSPLREM